MTAGQLDLKIDQGATWSQVITITTDVAGTIPLNLTGYTAAMMLRSTYDVASPSVSLTSPSGGLVLGGAAGTITATIPAATTATLAGTYVYDLTITSPSGTVTRQLQGTVTINPAATR